MIDLKEIHSLTEFQRNTKAHVERLKATGQPQVLTVNGRAELVIQDAAAYQRLLDALERAEAMEGVKRGLEDVKAGRTRPMRAALEDLKKRYER